VGDSENYMQDAAGPEPATPPPAPAAPAAGAPAGQPQAAIVPVRAPAPPQQEAKEGSVGHRVLHSVLNALGGENSYVVSKDASGNTSMTPVPKTPGQQWKTIIAGALTGLGAAADAGRGPGATGRALSLGVRAGMAQRQQQEDRARAQSQQDWEDKQKANLQKAQLSLLTLQMSELQLRTTREKKEAVFQDTNQEQEWLSNIKDHGGEDLGVAKSQADVLEKRKQDPRIMQAMTEGRIRQYALSDKDGNAAGIHYAMVPAEYGTMRTTEDSAFDYLAGYDKNGKPIVKTQTVKAGLYNNDELDMKRSAAALQIGKANETYNTQQLDKRKEGREEQVAAQTIQTQEAVEEYHREQTKALLNSEDWLEQTGEGIAKGNIHINEIPKSKVIAVESYLAEHHPNLNAGSTYITEAERKSSDQATAALLALNSIRQIVNRRGDDLLGTVYGRVSKGKTLLGTKDPDLASLAPLLDQYGLAGLGPHGTRGGLNKHDSILALVNDMKNGKQATLASIDAAGGTLQLLANVGKPKGRDGTAYVYKDQPGAAPAAGAAPPAGAVAAPGAAVGGIDPGEVQYKLPNGNISVFRNGQWTDTGVKAK